MEPFYKPPVRIALMKNFDSSNEHSSYYIQWKIGKSLSPDVQSLESPTFKAGHVEFEDEVFSLDWRFEYFIDDISKSIVISLVRTEDGDYDLDDSDDDDDEPDVPIVCRLAFVDKVTGVTKYGVSMFLESSTDLETDYVWKISLDEVKDLDLPNGDYVVYCWLDIPTKVIGGEYPSSVGRNNSGPALLLSGIGSLFEEVVGKKTDESKGTSDIVLITEKGEWDERRFNCHRAVLSVRSSVFNTMVTSKRFKEGNERDVDIDDVKGDVMELVLKYIYTGECPPKMLDASIPRVLDVVQKYMLPELKDECVRQLIDRAATSDGEWADRLALAEKYNLDYLKTISILALSSNIGAMGDEKAREKLSKGVMAELMDSAAKRWVRSKMMEVAEE